MLLNSLPNLAVQRNWCTLGRRTAKRGSKRSKRVDLTFALGAGLKVGTERGSNIRVDLAIDITRDEFAWRVALGPR